MAATKVFEPGNYRYIPGVAQYSAGVAAQPGYRIERVRFQRPVSLKEGFARIRATLEAAGRPLTAFCACELRSPAPFTEQGFRDFNAIYIGTLKEWNIYEEGRDNPVSRSNVCPAVNPPPEPSFHAFSFTVPDDGQSQLSFIVAGSAEAPETGGDYRANTISLDDVSPEGMAAKVRWVLDEMERRLAALGAGWADTTATQIYTVHDFHHMVEPELAARGVTHSGVTWHYNRPPVLCLDYEMDCRGVSVERVL